MDNMIGKRLDGRYELLELIGVGGMANVYKATDLLEERVVAVKVLRDEFVTNVDFVRRFKNESKAISLLDHPNIVKVYDVSVTDKVQYIVMEYVDGITLKEYIEQRPDLSWKETVHFVTQLLGALEQAHEKGIVHRDVKPQNIMLLADGSIKVMDFGIARFSRSERRTITDKAIGSVHYISPEQAQGNVTDNKSDIYSVGVMMYEMLTGTLPFDSDSPVGVAIKQISNAPKPLREIRPEIPAGLEEITLRAMEKDPKNRYQTAAEMLAAIEEFKKDPSIRFEYQYFVDPAPTKFIDKVANKDLAKKTSKNTKFKIGKFQFTLPMLAGMAAAFLVGALLLIFLIFKLSGNPLISNKKDVELPNFVGMTKEEVEAKVADGTYSFKFEFDENYNNDNAAGVIYDQSPKPPKTVKENQSITLRVSKGTQVVTVPDLTGKSRSEAEKALTDLGLNVNVVPTEDTTVGENKVIKTDPVAKTEVNSGTTVTVYIATSQKIQTVSVPNVVGQLSLEAAKSILENNGLTIGTISRVESDSPVGSIIAQSPVAGTEVSSGTQVNVTVSTGRPTPVTKSVAVTVSFTSGLVQGSVWTSSTGASYTYQGTAAASWVFYVDATENKDITISGPSGNHSIHIDYNSATATTLTIDTPKAPTSPSSPSSDSGSSSGS